MKPQDMIDVIQAHMDGKVVQAMRGSGPWIIIDNPEWDFRDQDYRVKPREPREWLIYSKYDHSAGDSFDAGVYPVDNPQRGAGKPIKVREVLE